MVRLKALRPCARPFPSSISIPYGAIKSATAARESYDFTAFQFHMVRLKARYHISQGFRLFSISIPYGAIKRKQA